MDHPMDDAPPTPTMAPPTPTTAPPTPTTNDPEMPPSNNSETSKMTSRGRRRLKPIRTSTMNDSEMSSAKRSNRRRKLSVSSSEDENSSSQVDDDICERPQKVTDFKVRVVERVVEREVVPAYVTQQIAEKDEQIQLLQQELEAKKTGKTKALREDDVSHSHSPQAAGSIEAERRRLRRDILDKRKTIESLTALNTQLQRDFAEVKQNLDALSKTAVAPDSVAAKDPEIESLSAKLDVAENEIKEKKLKARTRSQSIEETSNRKQDLEASIITKDSERAQLKEAVAVAEQAQAMEIIDLKQKLSDLDASIVAKDSHSQRLDCLIQTLKIERDKLDATVTMAQKEAEDESNARTVQVEQLKIRVKEFEEQIAVKESHELTLGNMIQSLEAENRKLEVTAALEKETTEPMPRAFTPPLGTPKICLLL
ncbi:hypothetical protein C8R41DRAFT_925713 [Lentinula lateritia]|uniref:Uncharacterized protein n=1 Tax=Lentinula lateritia TaxID=40482 RepID=A0ABQ8V698_9AGAR|nr:hypothetical protein C8R41DRAFT_925713 [Lentinula lateritia]